MWRVVCDKVVCVRWCVTKKDGACDNCVWKRGCDKVVCERCAKKAQRTVLKTTRPSPALLHEANEKHHCAIGSTAISTRNCQSQWPNFGNSSSHEASNHFLGKDIFMNDSLADYQTIHEAILRPMRECLKHWLPSLQCHQKSEHDNRSIARCINPCSKGFKQHCYSFISKQKRLDNTAWPKLLRTPCWRRYFFHGNKWFFTLVSSHLLYHTQRHVQSHFKQKHILPSSNLSDGHENSVAFIACDIQQVPGSNASDMQRKWFTKTSTKHRTTLTAKKVVYQKLSAWLARCPWAPASWASAWQQRKTNQKPTVSDVLTNTLCKTSSEHTAFRRKRMETYQNATKMWT